jgi:UDP-N-acetylglucosamine 2-epimerase (non-hydrolysing)
LNLLAENVPDDKIIVTGNTVIDALLEISSKIKNDSVLDSSLADQFSFLNEKKKLILVTGHRRENFGKAFESICQALKEIAQRSDLEIIYPVHLNPNVCDIVHSHLGDCPNIHLVEPLEYLPFVYLMHRSYFIITDSGGIQEEAPALGKPVLVIRDTTERPEAVESGTARLIGTNKNRIVQEAVDLLNNMALYEEMAQAHNPYGDGTAALQIVEHLAGL